MDFPRSQPTCLLLAPLALALGSMALWLTLVVVLTCCSGFASPGPVRPLTALKELIEELDNITQKVSAPLCNGSMVWSVNLTASPYCAALYSLMNISDCRAIQKTQRLLNTLCQQTTSAGVRPLPHTLPCTTPASPGLQVSSQPVRDTKVEVIHFAKSLLQQLRKAYRHGKFN
ncbi:PREDICTED: interleukin-13 [Miniopterus natalensis]|uniref:interleukin-13 n=1 Tax=Miniopterus natalensis TaxID=291302 RepID=UPI0007A7057A|nr:PREDICTED: interleukin-13 [Miniopterus natalensis]